MLSQILQNATNTLQHEHEGSGHLEYFLSTYIFFDDPPDIFLMQINFFLIRHPLSVLLVEHSGSHNRHVPPSCREMRRLQGVQASSLWLLAAQTVAGCHKSTTSLTLYWAYSLYTFGIVWPCIHTTSSSLFNIHWYHSNMSMSPILHWVGKLQAKTWEVDPEDYRVRTEKLFSKGMIPNRFHNDFRLHHGCLTSVSCLCFFFVFVFACQSWRDSNADPKGDSRGLMTVHGIPLLNWIGNFRGCENDTKTIAFNLEGSRPIWNLLGRSKPHNP